MDNHGKFICLNPLPHDKILGLPKLKASADDKLNVTQDMNVFFQRMENIVGKEQKCWLPAFSSLPTMFSKVFFPDQHVKSRH